MNTAALEQCWSILIMLLIEIGGLGFMMVPILCFALIKEESQSQHTYYIKEALNLEEVSGVMKLMLYILKLAFVIQLIGTVALSFVFVPEFGWLKVSGTVCSMQSLVL